MAKVCQEWFPLGSYYQQQSPGFYMHDTLKENIDVMVKNVKNDWDFVIVISGGGTVRVGKSVLALQIAAYWHYAIWKATGIEVPFSVEDNIVFNGSELITKGNKLGQKMKYGCLIFDEAGADLEGVKVMKATTQAVKDYLRECGQYNMLTILVLPDFFDLPKGIAVARSDFLLDCYTVAGKDDLWERGHFNFYSRPSKKWLYLKGKRHLDYSAQREDFHGDWNNMYPIDEEEYRKAKKKALYNRGVATPKEERKERALKAAIKWMHETIGSHEGVAEAMSKVLKMRVTRSFVTVVLQSIAEGWRPLTKEEYDPEYEPENKETDDVDIDKLPPLTPKRGF